MSLYAHLEIHTGMQMAPVSETLNVYGWFAPIFSNAGCNLHSLHGALGEQAAPVLQAAVENICREEIQILQAHGYDVLGAAKAFLSQLLADCKAHPKAVLCVHN